MAIYLGADHAGYKLKEAIERHLKERGFEVEDCGAFALNPEDDYPDFIVPVAEKVAENPDKNRGIVLGGSGQGEAIAANKVKGVRAVAYYGDNSEIIVLSRKHNNTNVLSLGARFVAEKEALDAVDTWLNTPFEGGRHIRRIQKIGEILAKPLKKLKKK